MSENFSYLSFNSKREESLKDLPSNIDGFKGVSTPQNLSQGGFFSNVEDNISVRPPFTRDNHNAFYPADAIPTKARDIMTSCRSSYERVGIIKSVIDLMTEISVEGLELVSDHKPTENFYKKWADRVNLLDRAERFSNYFLVEGNTVVRTKTGVIDTLEVRRLKRSNAIESRDHDVEPGVIPLSYVFYDPETIELIGGELAIFSGTKSYGIRISASNILKLTSLLSSNKKLISKLPSELIALLKSGNNLRIQGNTDMIIPIPDNRVYVDHFKKRDSEAWAKGFIYSILEDVLYNSKLRLAKLSALDSFYNAIRVWKLGDHTNEILPSTTHMNQLANILENHSGGTMDIIWDSMIDFQAHYPPIEKLEKFEENFESIMLGLGIHRSLVGGTASTGAAASAFVGLRNMMKRIDSVRRAVKRWLEHEIDIISKNLGFRNKPIVRFSNNNLFDQQSYFKLLTDLVDRDIVSNRTMVEKIGENWGIEKSRIKEQIETIKEGHPEKKGPFISPIVPEGNHSKTKEINQIGHKNAKEMQKLNAASNKELGNPVDKFKKTDKSPKKPKKQKGRPSGTKDTVKRNRRFRSKAESLIFVDKIIDKNRFVDRF